VIEQSIVSLHCFLKATYCDILGFLGNATVEWCVIVVFPRWRNNENKTFQRNNETGAPIQQCNGGVTREELRSIDQLSAKTRREWTHSLQLPVVLENR
jgi:hypothetical protein